MRHGSTWTYQRYGCRCDPCRAAANDAVKKYVNGRGMERAVARVRAYRAAHPERKQAHAVVERAIARGDLSRPERCACGRDVRIIAHHEDYTKPLEVMWLCAACHKARHRVLDESATHNLSQHKVIVA